MGFKGGLNWLGFRGMLAGFNSSIEVELVAGFQSWVESASWVELAWVAELVVGF